MATRRFGHKDDWVLKDGNIGINTSSPAEKLDVGSGNIRSDSLYVTGIATFSAYDSYIKNQISPTIGKIEGESRTLSNEIVIGTGTTLTVTDGSVSGQGSVGSLNVTNTFTPPIGETNDRPSAPQPGALFYNKDFRTIEYWDGNFWRQVDNTTASGRGVFGGRSGAGTAQFAVDSIQIATKGNAVDWGTMLRGRYVGQNCIGGETRVIFAGGYGLSPSPETSNLTAIDFGAFASGGLCADFGDITDSRRGSGTCGSSTRGIVWGGTDGATQLLDYIEIASLGNAVVFQDLGGTARGGQQCTASATRGVCAPNETDHITMNSITIASKGSFTEFGDHINKSYMGGFVSNGTRGVTGGGYNPLVSSYTQREIAYVNIASTGNAQYFGELTAGRGTTGVADRTRGVFGSQNPSTYFKLIDYIEFSTTGNATDFGDLVHEHQSSGIAGSDSHGGLGGF